ncbi:MAG: hypothetical protein ACOCTI_05760, partial [Phycisphaeraceae bacterium]
EMPLTEQPVERMLKAYQRLERQPGLPRLDQRIIDRRIAALQRNLTLARTLREVRQAREVAEQEPDMPERPVTPDQFDIVGQLRASSVYDGETLPRLFRVVDPDSGRTIAYVEPGDAIDAGMPGQVVGIVGQARRNADYAARLIDVRRAAVLGATD